MNIDPINLKRTVSIDEIPYCFFKTDKKSNLIQVNKSFWKTLGYNSQKECIGKNIAKYFFVNRSDFKKLHHSLLSSMSAVKTELTLLHKNRSHIIVSANCNLHYDERGNASGIIGTFHDISEYKQTEEMFREKSEQLEALNEKFEFILEATKTGVDIISKDYDLLYVDKRWKKKYGDYQGCKCYEYYMGRKSPCSTCGIPKALKTKRVVITEEVLPQENNRIIQVHTIPFKDRDGKWKVAEFNIDITEIRMAEKAMRESEHKFRTLVEHSPTGIFLVDDHFKFSYLNNQICIITGYERKEMTGMDFRKILASEDRQRVTDNYIRRQKGQKAPDQYYLQIVRKDGELRDILIMAAIVNNDGKVHSLGQLLDITEQKKINDLLLEREESLRSFIEHSTIGVVIIDEEGRIIEWNRAIESLLGIQRREAFSSYIWNLMSEIIPEVKRTKNKKQYFERIIKKNLKTGSRVMKDWQEWELQHRDGRRFVTQLFVFPIKTTKGFRYGILTQDITESKKAEEALKQSEERLMLSKNSSHTGMWDLDINTRDLIWDAQMYEIYGITETEFSQKYKDWETTVHPEDLTRVQEELQNAIKQKSRFNSEFRIKKSDGSVRIIEAHGIVTVSPKGHPLHMIGTNRDITARKKIEAERLDLERKFLHSQKLESLGILAGGIAHDFNNLLAIIVGNLDLALLKKSDDPDSSSNIKKALLASQRASDLTQQMLAYSGKGSFVLKDLDLNELVSDNIHLFQASISKNILLSVEKSEEIPLMQVDPGQIQQVVMNLLTNASEAIGDTNGKIILKIGTMECDNAYLSQSRLEEKPKAGKFIFLEVSDTGEGMDTQTYQRLFDPFFTTKFAGRGLGLSAVLGIIRSHKGAIIVNSEPGIGTTFRVLFPIKDVKSSSKKEKPEIDTSRHSNLLKGTVLVVDDEEAIRRTSIEFLSRLGLTIFEASDGEIACKIFADKKEEIDCVILDLTMPKMDGLVTFNELKRLRPELKVILCSGYSEKEAASRFNGRDLFAFLQKPYRLQELHEIIERILL